MRTAGVFTSEPCAASFELTDCFYKEMNFYDYEEIIDMNETVLDEDMTWEDII
jgi:hypothetical protein